MCAGSQDIKAKRTGSLLHAANMLARGKKNQVLMFFFLPCRHLFRAWSLSAFVPEFLACLASLSILSDLSRSAWEGGRSSSPAP